MDWARDLGIGTKLTIGFFFLICCVAVVSCVSFTGMRGIQHNLQDIFRINLPGIDYLIEIDRDLQQLLVAERSMLLAKPDTDTFRKLRKDYDENLKQSEDRWNKYKAIAAAPDEKVLIPKYEQARQDWKPVSMRVVDQALSGDESDKAMEMSLTEASEKFEKMRGVINDLTDIVLKLAEDEERQAADTYKKTISVFLAVSCLALLAGAFLVVGVRRAIVKPIYTVMETLNSGANQVAFASLQISSSSGQLAEGASEQAASIEETSSSLEEIASMTRQNAENAVQANSLMREAREIVAKANESMSLLTSSMQKISGASQETQKIIKTIDEIAFQTNLLALNAAVEAARAGEAGAGFAVVADEVRNLAIRAADAARSTANLIEGTVKNVKGGSDLVAKTDAQFQQVAATVAKSGELVGEIAAASQEQAQGIEQVNRAVAEMDKVVQSNSANAEESASTSMEMSAQAEQMKKFVAGLAALVGGKGNRASAPRKNVQIAESHPIQGKAKGSDPFRLEPPQDGVSPGALDGRQS